MNRCAGRDRFGRAGAVSRMARSAVRGEAVETAVGADHHEPAGAGAASWRPLPIALVQVPLLSSVVLRQISRVVVLTTLMEPSAEAAMSEIVTPTLFQLPMPSYR
ncbi:hypothetical protein NS226_24220 [Aureimonas ureilytica]|uniref:Uncharacterized protein n=1 Tax=Aureimonas ureilytica TaxID=401562 RepID=A0A175Q571_9HYPH|nr:hypothetical protein NS226_24220 [Aureimonas ureilytica]